jgi:hypothetical protein
MLYRCRSCQYEEARGFLPTVTCGMLLLAQMGVCAAVLIPSIRFARSLIQTDPAAIESKTSSGLGWWALLIVPLIMIVGFIALFIFAMILNAWMELIEWLAYCRRRCPTCGSRKWSWGFTRGFGL